MPDPTPLHRFSRDGEGEGGQKAVHRFGGGYEPPVGVTSAVSSASATMAAAASHLVLPSPPISRLRRSSLDYDLAGEIICTNGSRPI